MAYVILIVGVIGTVGRRSVRSSAITRLNRARCWINSCAGFSRVATPSRAVCPTDRSPIINIAFVMPQTPPVQAIWWPLPSFQYVEQNKCWARYLIFPLLTSSLYWLLHSDITKKWNMLRMQPNEEHRVYPNETDDVKVRYSKRSCQTQLIFRHVLTIIILMKRIASNSMFCVLQNSR